MVKRPQKLIKKYKKRLALSDQKTYSTNYENYTGRGL